MSKAFDLLNKKLRQYIYEEGWQSLRPIQAAAIEHSLKNDHNFILAAPTATGKTEAAFLPAINAVSNFHDGVKIIYISPLIALLNDQFKRLFKLCQDMDISVTIWHSEASRSKKQELLRHPAGILLITPESLEAMLTNRRGEAIHLFKGVEWIIIDELHAFLPTNRGIQLRSILERMERYYKSSPRYIAMSATISQADFLAAKHFFNSNRNTDVIVDASQSSFMATIDFFSSSKFDINEQIIKRIFEFSQNEAMLVFPNSRALVENIAVGLKQRARKYGSETVYFAHHASLSRETRLAAERFAKEADGRLFTICATSTLELGIDIGSVDSIVQYNAPFSAISLAQRLGRSGRKDGNKRLHLMATDVYALLQALACIELYRLKQLEPSDVVDKPFDVLAQQILALLMEYSGIELEKLYRLNHYFKTFAKITDDEMERLIDYLIEKEYIELLEEQAIVGISTERLLHRGDFYAHFKTESNYSVYSGEQKIGELAYSPAVQIGVNLFLAAQVWQIAEIIDNKKKLRVVPALDGKPPVYFGIGGIVSREVRQQMKKILYQGFNSSDEDISAILNQLKADFYIEAGYIFTEIGEDIALITFEGTKVNRTLQLLLNLVSGSNEFKLDDNRMAIWGKDLKNILVKLLENLPDRIDIYNYLLNNSHLCTGLLAANKYADLLPQYLRVSYVINNCLDLDGAVEFLQT